ncbi:MAG TPA: response regulator [Solirubrobacterales bacterium]|nr:response regulator [Solirubrobacterales bacterium]
MSRILIVDDSPSIRLLFVRRLEMDGHDTLEAADGSGAISAITDPAGEAPDMVLLDAMLPDMSGAEVLATLKRVRPDLPVLSVSAVAGLAQDEAWAGADGHLTKPIDLDDLIGLVESLTSGPPRP